MSRPLNQMTDVQQAKRLLLLLVPRRFSRWKRCSWGFCLGRLWVQWTPDKDVGGVDIASLSRLGSECYKALSRLTTRFDVDADVSYDVEMKVKAYTEELEKWCGVDRSAIRRSGGS